MDHLQKANVIMIPQPTKYCNFVFFMNLNEI